MMTMIKISNDVTIKQIMEVVNNETGEVSYLIMNDNDDEWRTITKDEYNKIRGNKDGE